MRWMLGLVLCFALGGTSLAQEVAAPTPSSASLAAENFNYRLGAGDKLRILVFGEESLTGEFLVPGGQGAIAFPLIGSVNAAGLTVTELQTQIETKLRDGFLKAPHVSIEVLNYRPFYILGEVIKPGEYPYTNGLTVLNAVATANGFTYRANTRKVYIKRANAPGEREYELKTTTPVEPGDTIRIGERFF